MDEDDQNNSSPPLLLLTSPSTTTATASPVATDNPILWLPSPEMALDLPIGSSVSPAPVLAPCTEALDYSLPPPPPPTTRLDPAAPSFRPQLDEQRSLSLNQFIKDNGGMPSPEEDEERELVIGELQKIVMGWAKTVANEQKMYPWLVSRTTAKVLTFGSYGLGVYGPESDIDALCFGPCIASLQHHFFEVLRKILEATPKVSELCSIESAKVPLMRFRFNGKLVDFPYVKTPVLCASEAINSFSPHLLQKLDSTSQMSISGVLVNRQIVELVPNLKKFQDLSRCVKLWARRRGLHCHALGFFAGVHLVILAAYVCQKHRNASINTLLTMFFEIFANWPWPRPVSLQDKLTHWSPDGLLMPIVMPCDPPQFCDCNVTNGTFRKIKQELQRGYALTKNLWRLDCDWSCLFEPFPYPATYLQFLRIALCAPTSKDLLHWAGWVKSRFRHLILKLESIGVECDPASAEQVDHTLTQPNVVFYWGLINQSTTHINTSSLKEDFMRSAISNVYGKVKWTHSDLIMSIVGPSQLPRSMNGRPVHSWYTVDFQAIAQN